MTRLTGLLLAATMSVMLLWLLVGCASEGNGNGGQQQQETVQEETAQRKPAGSYVTCSVGPYFGKAGENEPCLAPGPETPKDDILYCEGTSRADVNPVYDRCY